MRIETELVGQVIVVKMFGEVNSRTANLVEETLLPLVRFGCKLLLNLEGVEYMSSAGLRMLLLLHREVENQSGQVVLVGLREMIRDTMSITGFLDFFQDYETVEAGLKALGYDETD